MAGENINNQIFDDDDSAVLNLDIETELRFSRKDHPEGKMVPVSIDGKEEFILIPLDVKDGAKLKFRGRGKHHPRAGKTGDLYVLVHIEEKTFPWKKILVSAMLIVAVIVAAFLMSKKMESQAEVTTEPATTSCTHVWIPADCTTPQTCEICGEVSGSALGHQWQEATYDAPKTCSVCGATEGTAIEKPSVKVNDIITFGTYEQDGLRGNGAEPIEWLVLDVQSDRMLLLNRYALDSKPYNNTYIPVTWESCSLRNWLNNTFLNNAFTEDERKQILLTEVDNSRSQGNREWHISGGNNTEDAIFLLSYSETEQYFDNSFDRMCLPTSYAVSQGADVRIHDDGITESGWWWLRSPGETESQAAFVNFDGTRYTNAVGNEYLSVRPALWIGFGEE